MTWPHNLVGAAYDLAILAGLLYLVALPFVLGLCRAAGRERPRP